MCGCWQFVAVWRERQELRQGKVTDQSQEYSFYCTSAAPKQYAAGRRLQKLELPAQPPPKITRSEPPGDSACGVESRKIRSPYFCPLPLSCSPNFRWRAVITTSVAAWTVSSAVLMVTS